MKRGLFCPLLPGPIRHGATPGKQLAQLEVGQNGKVIGTHDNESRRKLTSEYLGLVQMAQRLGDPREQLLCVDTVERLLLDSQVERIAFNPFVDKRTSAVFSSINMGMFSHSTKSK